MSMRCFLVSICDELQVERADELLVSAYFPLTNFADIWNVLRAAANEPERIKGFSAYVSYTATLWKALDSKDKNYFKAMKNDVRQSIFL